MAPIIPPSKDIAETAAERLIAIVDDDAEIVIALTAWLGLIGCLPVGFSSAESMVEALVPGGEVSGPSIKLAGERTGQLTGAVIDVMLPAMSGFQLADRLRAAAPEISIVLMSAATSTQLAHLGHAPDGVRLLPKPFDLTELAAALFGPRQGAGRVPG
jgi:CheY-like chemotaxis protein